MKALLGTSQNPGGLILHNYVNHLFISSTSREHTESVGVTIDKNQA